MARPEKRYHYIYKIICNESDKYYIGMHSTSNLEDGYMGSGKRIRYSIRKYGVENHTKEILEFLEDRESLVKRETEIVNEELISDPLCMNLKVGGLGGCTDEVKKIWQTAGKNGFQKKLQEDPLFKERMRNVARTEMIRRHKEGLVKYDTFTGKTHTEESKKLIGEKTTISQKGKRNSQYGTCWITDEIENKKIKKGDLIPEGWRLGRL